MQPERQNGVPAFSSLAIPAIENVNNTPTCEKPTHLNAATGLKQGAKTEMANAERRYADGYWDDKDEYLAQSWLLRHNDDYLQFLVEKVWKLTEPRAVVDFGCG